MVPFRGYPPHFPRVEGLPNFTTDSCGNPQNGSLLLALTLQKMFRARRSHIKMKLARTSRAPRSRILKLPKESSGVLGILTRPKSCLQGVSFKPFQKLRFATQGGRAPESSVKTTWHRPQRKVKIGSSAKFTPPEKGLISIREAPKAAK